MKVQGFPKTRSFRKSKSCQSLLETDIQSSYGLLTPKQALTIRKKKYIKKKNQIDKLNQKKIFHENIFRYSLKRAKKTMRIYCFKQSDMGWPQKYACQISEQEIDNDVDSDSQLIEHEIKKCKKNLLDQIKQFKAVKKTSKQQV